MTGKVETAVRKVLRANPDGLTVRQLIRELGMQYTPTRRQQMYCMLRKQMPDSYVDRWQPAHKSLWEAVWCVVVPPEDCPRPEGGSYDYQAD